MDGIREELLGADCKSHKGMPRRPKARPHFIHAITNTKQVDRCPDYQVSHITEHHVPRSSSCPNPIDTSGHLDPGGFTIQATGTKSRVSKVVADPDDLLTH